MGPHHPITWSINTELEVGKIGESFKHNAIDQIWPKVVDIRGSTKEMKQIGKSEVLSDSSIPLMWND